MRFESHTGFELATEWATTPPPRSPSLSHLIVRRRSCKLRLGSRQSLATTGRRHPGAYVDSLSNEIRDSQFGTGPQVVSASLL